MCGCAPLKRGTQLFNASSNAPVDKASQLRTEKMPTRDIHILPCGNCLSWASDGRICIEVSVYMRRYSTYFQRSMRQRVLKKLSRSLWWVLSTFPGSRKESLDLIGR